MPLVLTLHRARDPVDRQRESRTLDEGTLTIGRGTGNTWVLQDPAQHLSKTHCIVSATRGGYMLTDCSSNGVFLNGGKQRMPRDSQVEIDNGDEFVIGDYLIQARDGRGPVEPCHRRRSRLRPARQPACHRAGRPVRAGRVPRALGHETPPPSAAPPPAAPPPARVRPLRRPGPRAPGRSVRRRRPARRSTAGTSPVQRAQPRPRSCSRARPVRAPCATQRRPVRRLARRR